MSEQYPSANLQGRPSTAQTTLTLTVSCPVCIGVAAFVAIRTSLEMSSADNWYPNPKFKLAVCWAIFGAREEKFAGPWNPRLLFLLSYDGIVSVRDSDFLIYRLFTVAMDSLPQLAAGAHASHCNRCLLGLPSSQVDIDPFKLALAFYCLGSLDLTGQFTSESRNTSDKEAWRQWIWAQQIQGSRGTGFRPGNYMKTNVEPTNSYTESSEDPPHVILTYTALLSLAILRDNFSQLDRPGIIKFLQACQNEDGSFSSEPYGGDSDVRTTYCAFAISTMLDDWSGVRVEPALKFIATCRSYEGGYGQVSFAEAAGGPTYCALASIFLANEGSCLSDTEKKQTIRWLTQNQLSSGGYCGRTNKEADACYSFWCGASLAILGAREFVCERSLAKFIASCQFKFGGISKAPKEHPDPYHTYLSLAAISMYPPSDGAERGWKLQPLDPLLNTNEATSKWARKYIQYKS